ncbi:MAG: hypothetical protein RXR32_00530 [Candidatus Micrarchaeota archaeon]
MDFWGYFKSISAREKFSEEKITLGSVKSTYLPSERVNTSIALISDFVKEIKVGDIIFEKNSFNTRYIYANNLTYDILVSIYSVSNESGIFFRTALPLNKDEAKIIKRLYGRIEDRNIEVRIIGMQNKQVNAKDLVNSLLFLEKIGKNSLVEVDLFGNEVRHVAIDLKTGLSYNVLIKNIIYRPGELINNLSFDDFSKNVSRLKLV